MVVMEAPSTRGEQDQQQAVNEFQGRIREQWGEAECPHAAGEMGEVVLDAVAKSERIAPRERPCVLSVDDRGHGSAEGRRLRRRVEPQFQATKELSIRRDDDRRGAHRNRPNAHR